MIRNDPVTYASTQIQYKKRQNLFVDKIFTSRVCGRGNVFVMSVCLSVCLSVRDTTFEAVGSLGQCNIWGTYIDCTHSLRLKSELLSLDVSKGKSTTAKYFIK